MLAEAFKAIIDKWFVENLKDSRKQRHTEQRIYSLLVDEYKYIGSAVTVRNYVYQKRKLLGLDNKIFVRQI